MGIINILETPLLLLLVEATASFRLATGNSNYFLYLREMLEKKPDRVLADYLLNLDLLVIIINKKYGNLCAMLRALSKGRIVMTDGKIRKDIFCKPWHD